MRHETGFSPPVKYFTSFVDHLCYLCLVFVMLSRLFIAAMWPHPGKGLTSWLMLVVFSFVFVNYPCGALGQVWYLIVFIPDLCRLAYFDKHFIAFLNQYNELYSISNDRFYLSYEN